MSRSTTSPSRSKARWQGARLEQGCLLDARLAAPVPRCVAADYDAMLAWYADGEWEPLMRRALDIALTHGAVTEAAFAYTNMHDLCHSDRRYTECGQHYAAGVAYCEEHDMGTYLCCLQGTQSVCLERLGQWDEAVALAETVLRRILSSPINRMMPEGALGRILARRDVPGAGKHLDIALASADNSGMPEYVVPMRLGRAEACWLRGDLNAARRESELACMAAADTSRWLRGETAVWLRRTGHSLHPGRPSRRQQAASLRADTPRAGSPRSGQCGENRRRDRRRPGPVR